MSYKRPFDDVMRDFIAENPCEVEKLNAEEIAERTGYSINTVRQYLAQQPSLQAWRKREQEEKQRRVQETKAYTYNASSGNVRVIYYPLLADVKIMNTSGKRQVGGWGPEAEFVLLSSQDAIEIGIYLLGLQPHIRGVLAQKDNVVQELPVEYPAPAMIDQDI